jgi:uncharacterized membrane protein YbhN (UPF0104 family)
MTDPQPDRQNRLVLLLRITGTVLALGLLLYLLTRQGWGEIAAAFAKLSWWQIGMALALTFISRFAVAMRWFVLLRSAKTPITAGQAVRITFAGLFASNFLPTTIGGDVVRLGGALRMGCDRGAALASLVVDRLVGMAGMAMAAPLSLPAFLDSGWQKLFSDGAVGAGMVASGGRWGKVIVRVRLEWRKLADALMIWWKNPSSLLLSLGSTWVHMICLFASIDIFLRGMGERMPFWLIAGVWSLTYFITLLPISINGLGVQEASTTLLFAGLGSISMASAITLSVLIRVVQLFVSLPGAFFVPEMIVGDQRKATGVKR